VADALSDSGSAQVGFGGSADAVHPSVVDERGE
jgi:hypothetical protein